MPQVTNWRTEMQQPRGYFIAKSNQPASLDWWVKEIKRARQLTLDEKLIKTILMSDNNIPKNKESGNMCYAATGKIMMSHFDNSLEKFTLLMASEAFAAINPENWREFGQIEYTQLENGPTTKWVDDPWDLRAIFGQITLFLRKPVGFFLVGFLFFEALISILFSVGSIINTDSWKSHFFNLTFLSQQLFLFCVLLSQYLSHITGIFL